MITTVKTFAAVCDDCHQHLGIYGPTAAAAQHILDDWGTVEWTYDPDDGWLLCEDCRPRCLCGEVQYTDGTCNSFPEDCDIAAAHAKAQADARMAAAGAS